jgi:hypothetical protein
MLIRLFALNDSRPGLRSPESRYRTASEELRMGIGDWIRGGKRKDEEGPGVGIDLTSIDGSPELQDLFIAVSGPDVLQAIDGWKWLPLKGLTAIAVSAFGEVFFRDAAGGIHQIDTIEGTLAKVADTLPAFTAILQETEARDRLLLAGLVAGARESGLLLAVGECYVFRLPPVLGGEMRVETMTKLSFVVKLDLAGQLHEQVRALPPGTPINGIQISP